MSNEELTMEVDIITLTMDDDTNVECEVLGFFEVEEQEYIALLPIEDEEESEVYLYRYSEDAEGNPVLENLENDEEFEKAGEAFDAFLDSLELDDEEEEA